MVVVLPDPRGPQGAKISPSPSRLLKKTHMLRCAQLPRSNVPPKYASARRFFARLASEIFLTSLQTDFSNNLLAASSGKGLQETIPQEIAS